MRLDIIFMDKKELIELLNTDFPIQNIPVIISYNPTQSGNLKYWSKRYFENYV